MKKRGLIGILAFILALVGGVFIFNYVREADARALADQQPAPVLIVTADIPEGTLAKNLGDYVEVRNIPRVALAPGAVANAADLPGTHVTTTSLTAGEQVLAARFAEPDPEQLKAAIPIPADLELVSIRLSPERVVGSQIAAGDKVALLASVSAKIDPASGNAEAAADSDAEQSAVVRLDNNVLVARVQGVPATASDEAAASTTPSTQEEFLPGSDVIVTLAVKVGMSERIIFSHSTGGLWLTLQQPTTEIIEDTLITSENILK